MAKSFHLSQEKSSKEIVAKYKLWLNISVILTLSEKGFTKYCNAASLCTTASCALAFFFFLRFLHCCRWFNLNTTLVCLTWEIHVHLIRIFISRNENFGYLQVHSFLFLYLFLSFSSSYLAYLNFNPNLTLPYRWMGLAKFHTIL